TASKDLSGKTVQVFGGWSSELTGELTGQIIVNKKTGEIRQIETSIDVATLWAEQEMLRRALVERGFFDLEQHPKGVFVTSAIKEGAPEGSKMEGATHTITGNFALNGEEKSISVPAKVDIADGQLTLNSEFAVNRNDFNVEYRNPWPGMSLTDENILPNVVINVSIEAEAAGIGESETPQVAMNGESTGNSDATNDEATGGTNEPAETVDVASLPKTYTDQAPAYQVPFEMVLVPGNPEKGIKPFYMGKTEVTWDEFMPWVIIKDKPAGEHGKLRAMNKRPSPPYGEVDRNFGTDGRPALSMSRLSAELFCKFLSEQTGRSYRLPTEQEWLHAYQLGGGKPDSPVSADDANKIGVYADNAWDDDIGDWATRPVGSMAPNELGIHDMAGNVAEWVTDTGEERVVRGGHFDGPLEEFGVSRLVEDQAVWNMGYP
ncbi:MAG: SUMF1/EgtB/PvdO family nonheme iron enzyme, partial [Rhodospirillales bacterium]|nr:SUMF1/EgtB/PvdO family nonheme iron enzyme [Rhodospirillales bacterium]